MENLLAVVAYICFGLLACSFVVYPLMLGGLSKIWRQTASTKVPGSWPVVSLVIACYNEEEHIERKLINSLALDYPREKLEVIVFSDGSTDATDDIAQRFQGQGVKLVRVAGRLGKTHCQNEVAAIAKGEILVFSDANTMYSKNAIEELVTSLVPKDVGVAIGRRVYVGAGKPGNQEGLYERLENWMKQKESVLGGTIGANGSMYAVKAKYFIELPIDRMSDIVEPLRVAVTHSLKVTYASGAIGSEEHGNDFKTEFRRKRRIVLRAMNSMWAERAMLMKRPDLVFKLIFHKVIRWLTLPLLVIGGLASLGAGSAVLSVLGVGVFCYLGVSLFILFKVWLRSTDEQATMGRFVSLMLYSIGVFLSATVAAWDFLRGRNIRVWESRA